MFYRPKLSDGKDVPLSWPLAAFRLLNHVCWPVEDNVGVSVKIFDRILYIFGFLLFVQHNDAEFRYILSTFSNIDDLLMAGPTYLVLVEIHMRAFQLGLQKEKFKRFMQKFYRDIYIEESLHPKLFRSIRRKLRPTIAYSSSYFLTLGVYLTSPILNYFKQRRDPLFKMIFPFDHTPLFIYILVLCSNIYVGYIVISTIVGEANVLSEGIMHLNGRYIMLGEDLQRASKMMLKQNRRDTISEEFARHVKRTIQQNEELNLFALEFHDFFSYRIFVLFSVAAALLCTLMFKLYTNFFESYMFIFWICAKLAEMLAIGEIGSTLIATTNDVSSMYYHSNWELIIAQSTNTRENIRLMKLLVTAIETNRKPIQMSGLNFFSVSLTAVVKILQGAGSYFTCLISFR